jgi:hypothetical protein
MKRTKLTAGVLAFGAALCLAAPATPRSTGAATIKLVYTETFQGKDKGQNDVLGATGKGTLTLVVKGTRSPVLAVLAKGVPIVAQHDEHYGKPEVWRGLITGKSQAIGTVCAAVVVTFGKYDPNAGTGFAPASGTFSTVGGTGPGATLKLTGTYKVTGVEGTKTLTITATGTATATTGPSKAPAAGCPR